MRYRERRPAKALSRWLHCVWTFENEGSGAPDRIVPDGRAELVIHHGEPFHESGAQGDWVRQPRVLFAGQLTRPLRLRAAGRACVVGVRFRPAGARAFLGAPLRDATDRRIAVAGLDPRDAADPEAAEAFVLDRIERLRIQDDEPVRACAERIEAAAGQVSTAELVALAGLGRRQLERRFAETVGIGPALLAAIFRFRSVFDVIEHDAARPWTDAAVAAGYYDQSHFIREFRRFVGCTPSDFQRSRGALAGALVQA